jgi:outer membrane protein assembly factor BamE (lipoprotein component of BamABCDE complex)
VMIMRNYPKFGGRGRFCWLILLALVVVALVGCTRSKINQQNFDKIKLGMTQEKVQQILGPPTEASSLEVAVFSGSHAKWVQGDSAITIQFLNGKVVAKEFSKPPQK